MIHQAYLAEEAKVTSVHSNHADDNDEGMINSQRRSASPYSTASSSMRRSEAHPIPSQNGTHHMFIPSQLSPATSSSATNTDPLRSNTLTNTTYSTSQEEMVRLKEIETRLADIEALHLAAEHDRNEVALLKRDL